MKKEYLVCLQVLVLLLIFINHFLVTIFYFSNPRKLWFGIEVTVLIIDITLIGTLILQLYLIIEQIRR